MKDGEDYGYESASSDADKAAGLKAKPLVIFRYLGRKGDTYQVVLINDKFRNVFEVTKPFEFAKIHSFYGDRYQGKEMMRLTDGTLAAAAVRDAMLGHMKQFTRVEKGVVTTLWVDGEKKSLVVEAAATSGVVQ
jgi:inhibitor of KinA sporulation pathway (predicted exonuclease)